MNTKKHCAFCSFVPPHIMDKLAESDNADVRKDAIESIKATSAARATRLLFSAMPAMAAVPSSGGQLSRRIYDMKNSSDQLDLPSPGNDPAVRTEGGAAAADGTVNRAYDHSGSVYKFVKEVFGRNSLDNNGMTLISSVHFGRRYNNAFWNGEQMAYGDGDGIIFGDFTKSLDVVGHELAHGITSFTSDLLYKGQPGALNEHFSDVIGVMVQQWSEGKTVDNDEDWRIGDEIMLTVDCLRTMTKDKAYTGDPYLGTDPQPKHMKNYDPTPADSFGVHINSGIPNHAFYLAARKLGGHSWEKAGKIWFETFTKRLHKLSDFKDAAERTIEVAGQLYGSRSPEQDAVADAWNAVGVEVLSLV